MTYNIENRTIKKYGLRKGAYDGARGRRFVIFDNWLRTDGNESRREFDNKKQRDDVVWALVVERKMPR